MSHDWISSEKAKSFPLRKFYVGLRWSKMVKGALKNYKQKLTNIYEILTAADSLMTKETKAVSILATGNACRMTVNFLCDKHGLKIIKRRDLKHLNVFFQPSPEWEKPVRWLC